MPKEVVEFYAKTRNMIRIAHLNELEEDRKYVRQEQLKQLRQNNSMNVRNVEDKENQVDESLKEFEQEDEV